MASPNPVSSLWELSIIGGATIDFYTQGFEPEMVTLLSEDGALGDTVSTIFVFAIDSPVVRCQGDVYTEANADLIEAAMRTFTSVSVSNDLGSNEGTYKIMDFQSVRVDANNYSSKWHRLNLELRRVS